MFTSLKIPLHPHFMFCTASVEVVYEGGPGFSMGRELQQLQPFSVFLIVTETPDMKMVLIFRIPSCCQYWRQSTLCVFFI